MVTICLDPAWGHEIAFALDRMRWAVRFTNAAAEQLLRGNRQPGLVGVNAAHWLRCHAVHKLAAGAILGHEIENGSRLEVTQGGILLRLRPAVFAPEQTGSSVPHKIDQNGDNLLARARVFAGLNPAALAEVAAGASKIALMAGEPFFAQGDPAKAFFVLLEGRVRITQVTPEGHQVTLRYIGPGQMFGAVPLFAGGPYPASALAVLACTAARWDLGLTSRLAQRHPAILANALTIIGGRLQEMQDRYRELATERVERRIARVVLHLAQSRDGADPDREIDFPISRQDIADMAGATLHTASRILSSWEQRGLLENHRMRIRIVQPAAVRAIADDLPERPSHPR